jgi:hypothetical protein
MSLLFISLSISGLVSESFGEWIMIDFQMCNLQIKNKPNNINDYFEAKKMEYKTNRRQRSNANKMLKKSVKMKTSFKETRRAHALYKKSTFLLME